VFPKIFLLHKVVRDAKKVEKHCSSSIAWQVIGLQSSARKVAYAGLKGILLEKQLTATVV